MLAALQRENETLRSPLADMERDYVRISRLNEVFREELLEHRNRVRAHPEPLFACFLRLLQLGIPVDHLIGLASSGPYSQPTHQRPQPTYSSNASSPTNSVLHAPISRPTNGFPIPRPAAQTNGVPILRPPTQLRRAGSNTSEGTHPSHTRRSTSPPSCHPTRPAATSA